MAASLPADLKKVDPADAWTPWVPTPEEPWNRKRVAHLYRRAAFGATADEITAALKVGFPKTLERLLTGSPDADARFDLLKETGKYYNDTNNLRAWWLYAIFESGHPLREKLTLFWHNHFATSYAKVRSTQLMYEQNVTLRRHALGRFRPFLLDMSKDTAMLVWLDSNRNVKGAPNENYAREIMELFSLGVGNYTEQDIREAARAFTGWHHDIEVSEFKNNPALHDDGEKTIFGKTGRWTGADVVRLCCDHQSCAQFLVGKLYAYLVSEEPPPEEYLAPLVEQFRKSDYDIADLAKTMLGSRLFFSQIAYKNRVKWPVEYAVEAVHSAVPAGRVPLSDLVEPLAKMGQVLFAPPNVKGWRTGTDWLNSATLLARNNFAETVALGKWSPPNSRPRGSAFDFGFRARAFFEEPNEPESGGPPPPPLPQYDVVKLIYATKPKDISAIVQRMGEVLNGEPLPKKVATKIEAFLREPPSPEGAKPVEGPMGYTAPSYLSPEQLREGSSNTLRVADLVKPQSNVEFLQGFAKPDPKPVAVAPEPRVAPPREPDVNSAEFHARVREAMHAVMCLPDYQLN